MSETINFTRLTTSDKLPDRFLTCQYYQPVEPEQKDQGVIFSQIEILTAWFPTAQIGQTVINTLIREYYRGSDTSVLVNFENAIKAVNKVLAQIAQNGETDWIGKFSGCLALINGREIHIAQTGLSQAYLYRDDKINHITEGLDQDEAPHPLKTFSNLTSGSLQANDKIVIGNASYFDVLKPTELKVLVSSFRPAIIALETAKILKSHNCHSANAIIIELTDKNSLANVPPEQKIETVYLDQSSVNLSLAAKNFMSEQLVPVFRSVANVISGLFKQTSKLITPAIKKGVERARETSVDAVDFAKKTAEKSKSAIFKDKTETKAAAADNPSKPGLLKRTTVFKTKNRIRRILIGIGLYSRDKSKMVLAILALIILVLVASLGFSFYKRFSNQSTKADETKYNQLSTLETEATVAQTRGDEPTALQRYKDILAIAAQLQSSKKYKDAVSPYISRSDAKIKAITKLTDLSPSKTYDLAADAQSILTNGENIYAIYKNGDIKIKKSADPIFGTFGKSNIGDLNIHSQTMIPDLGQFALLLKNRNLDIFDPRTKTITKQDINLESTGKIASFGTNLYLLEPLKNQILKIAYQDNQYKNTSNYIKDTSINLADAVDLAIDGSIYVLSKSRAIIRFSRGIKSDNFQITLLAGETLNSYQYIATSDTYSDIIVIAPDQNGARAVVITKAGKFLKQYRLTDTDTDSRFYFDLKNNRILALTGNKLATYQL